MAEAMVKPTGRGWLTTTRSWFSPTGRDWRRGTGGAGGLGRSAGREARSVCNVPDCELRGAGLGKGTTIRRRGCGAGAVDGEGGATGTARPAGGDGEAAGTAGAVGGVVGGGAGACPAGGWAGGLGVTVGCDSCTAPPSCGGGGGAGRGGGIVGIGTGLATGSGTWIGEGVGAAGGTEPVVRLATSGDGAPGGAIGVEIGAAGVAGWLGDAATAGGPDGDAGGLVEVPPPSVGAELGAGGIGDPMGGLGVISRAMGATG